MFFVQKISFALILALAVCGCVANEPVRAGYAIRSEPCSVNLPFVCEEINLESNGNPARIYVRLTGPEGATYTDVSGMAGYSPLQCAIYPSEVRLGEVQVICTSPDQENAFASTVRVSISYLDSEQTAQQATITYNG